MMGLKAHGARHKGMSQGRRSYLAPCALLPAPDVYYLLNHSMITVLLKYSALIWWSRHV
jgi:hypothetical protein